MHAIKTLFEMAIVQNFVKISCVQIINSHAFKLIAAFVDTDFIQQN